MVTGLAHSLADKPTSATRYEQSHQQVNPVATARGLTPPARLFSFVLLVVPLIRLVAARSRAGFVILPHLPAFIGRKFLFDLGCGR